MNIIQEDPNCTILHVVHQTSSHSCIICNAQDIVQRLPVECRVNVFIVRNIYVPENVRSCAHHLDENGLFGHFLADFRYINRPNILKGNVLESFLQNLRETSAKKERFLSENNFTDEELECIAPITKEQFHALYTYCEPVLQ